MLGTTLKALHAPSHLILPMLYILLSPPSHRWGNQYQIELRYLPRVTQLVPRMHTLAVWLQTLTSQPWYYLASNETLKGAIVVARLATWSDVHNMLIGIASRLLKSICSLIPCAHVHAKQKERMLWEDFTQDFTCVKMLVFFCLCFLIFLGKHAASVLRKSIFRF